MVANDEAVKAFQSVKKRLLALRHPVRIDISAHIVVGQLG